MIFQDNGPRIVISMWVMTGVASLFMGLRFFCKRRYSKVIGSDDFILFASWTFLVIYASMTTVAAANGIGKHIDDLDESKTSLAIKLLYIGEFFAIIALAVSKTSFAATLLRFALERWRQAFLWFIIISLNAIMLTCAVLPFAQCTPTKKLWEIEVEGTCWDTNITVNFSIFAGSFSAAMDFALAVFPWLVVKDLQMNKREKIGVAFAMSLGVLAGITAIVKTSYLPSMARSTDFTYYSANLLIWAAAETAITIIAASIPFLRLLIKAATSSLTNSPYGRSGSYNLQRLSVRRDGTTSSRTATVQCGIAEPVSKKQDDRSDRSDKSILGVLNPTKTDIVHVQEVKIEYHDREDEESQREPEQTRS
ncbi:hypothetical protein BDY21DRAFT_126629 [Lineolata rhizophorae]|uniref:Rhodopsin domain-containing protein n=1 Tax=Lineolata rhizophorae TaxID=578093 RepID=A0A6A6NQ13_9PEZI|nr:hypothetical protein BDY21DRAFT_126629 [Lineolata rhizophorae]